MQCACASDKLNPEQQKVAEHLMQDCHEIHDGPIPFIVYGPFGTGKTFTLATATLALLKKESKKRVLICTHSNRYFHNGALCILNIFNFSTTPVMLYECDLID